mmetsp:Transcript_3429/g.4666  ORF Transcript_3429/g.4666 Transcript_3429/m.4666 type:complete len:141 (-) Transcript_3429:248-670(-)
MMNSRQSNTMAVKLYNNIVAALMNRNEAKEAQKEGRIYGPLSVLRNLFIEKKRARVLIRGVKRVKVKVTGYLRAFDKHCNMILFDVLETSALRLAETPLKSRHMNQLFIRGENVVVVSVDPTAPENDENDQKIRRGSRGR